MKHLQKFSLFEAEQYKGYDFENKWYHASGTDNTSSILKDGLSVELGKKQWENNEYPKGIYLFADKDDAILYAVMFLELGDVWEVDTSGLYLYEDPEEQEDSYFEDSTSVYVTSDIPVNKVKLVPMSTEDKEELWIQYESGELLANR